MMEFTDGNALAGPLREVFAVDVTVALSHCTGCGRTGELAGLHVYQHAPGLVARCPGCGAVMLRLVRGRDCAWLDMRGTVSLRIPLPDSIDAAPTSADALAVDALPMVDATPTSADAPVVDAPPMVDAPPIVDMPPEEG